MNLKFRLSAGLRNFAVLTVALIICGGADASKLKVLYAFCPDQQCSDGGNSAWPLTRDSAGNLYGITSGTPSSGATVFKLSPGKGGWALTRSTNSAPAARRASPLRR